MASGEPADSTTGAFVGGTALVLFFHRQLLEQILLNIAAKIAEYEMIFYV
jgi:hypothetical protein